MAGNPPPYPPPPYGPPQGDWRYQRRVMREHERMQRAMYRQQREAYKHQQAAYRYQSRRLRRSSIVGPILLLAIGLVFLLVQIGRLPGDRVWNWYGQWWPLLLIGVGVVVLLEWIVDRIFHHDGADGVPYVRRGVGGGVITLLAILAILGIVFQAIHRADDGFLAHKFGLNPDDLEQFLGDKHESDQTLLQALPAGGSLQVDNPRGDVTISGTSDDNQIHIMVHKEVYSRSDSDAADKAQKLSPAFTAVGSTLQLRIPALEGAQADLMITLPSSAPETIVANHGDVHISQIKGAVNVTANHGDVELSAINGAIDARIHNSGSSFSAHDTTGAISLAGRGGDLTLADINGTVGIQGDFFGSTHLEHIRGGVHFHTSRTDLQLARLDGELNISSDEDLTADQAVGPVILSTRDRNITLDRIAGDLSVTNRNGSVTLTSAPPLGNVTVENRNGAVNLTVPTQASFNVHAETDDGDIDDDFSLPLQKNDQRSITNGTVGHGGPAIRISTTQSDISIKKATIAPIPPAPPAPPPLSVKDSDGSSVYIGKDGVRITDGADGSSVIVGKDGVHINANADGSKTYTARDGSSLVSNVDGSYIYVGTDGTRFISNADGSKNYTSKDGTRILINADGSHRATGPSGSALGDAQIKERLTQAERDVKRMEEQRDAERRHAERNR